MGGLRRANTVRLLAQSGIVTATTLWVLAAASAFAWILVREWVPQTIGEWIVAVGAGRTTLLVVTVIVFVAIGALLEGLPALLIFGPILFPISRSIGLDPVHYGIVIVAAMGIAFFLPPVGVGLSIAAGIARVDIDRVSRTYVPYLVALLAGLALVAAFPVADARAAETAVGVQGVRTEGRGQRAEGGQRKNGKGYLPRCLLRHCNTLCPLPSLPLPSLCPLPFALCPHLE